jgi:hypothetical protein
MDVIKKGIPGLFIMLMLAVAGNCFAQQNKTAAQSSQRPTFYFDKPITLDSLTQYVHRRSKIRFSFNSTKVKGDKVINLKKGIYTIELLLQQIRKNTSLYYSMYNGYVIFQDNPPKPRKNPVPVAKKSPVKPPSRKQSIPSQRQPASVVQRSLTPVAPKDTNKTAGKTGPVSQNLEVAKQVNASDTSNLALPPGKLPVQLVVPPAAPPKKASANTDNAQNKRIASTNDENSGLTWQYGLQWKAGIPLYGFKNYFTGPDNRSQPYNLLIPGAWVSAMFNNKHEVLLVAKPAEWYLFDRNKVFRNWVGFDTALTLLSTRLVKTGNVYAGLQYNFHLNEHWIVGAGVGYYLRGRGLVYQKEAYAAGNKALPDTMYSVKSDSIASKYLKTSIITGNFEVAYHFGAVDLGTTVQMPLTNPFTSQSKDNSRPLNLQLFVRWRIKRSEQE